MADKIEKIIADTFLQMAEGLETGNFGKKPRIALTGMGSEHGEENAMEAAKMAAKDGIDVYYIGTLEADGVTTVKVSDDEEGHKKMEELLASHEIDGAVTMHFPFPIGVSTVGRVVTPAKGREMFIANTTGTSSSDRCPRFPILLRYKEPVYLFRQPPADHRPGWSGFRCPRLSGSTGC